MNFGLYTSVNLCGADAPPMGHPLQQHFVKELASFPGWKQMGQIGVGGGSDSGVRDALLTG